MIREMTFTIEDYEHPVKWSRARISHEIVNYSNDWGLGMCVVYHGKECVTNENQISPTISVTFNPPKNDTSMLEPHRT